MFHANPMIRRGGFGIGFLADFLLLPECYATVSVKDFVDTRKEVKPTPLYKITNMGGRVLVAFTNVNLDFLEIGYEISDLTERITINEGLPGMRESARRENLDEGRYSRVSIQYDIKSDIGYLQATEKFTFPTSEKEPEERLEGILKPAFVIS